MNNSFELKVKNMLNWTSKQWNEGEEKEKGMKRIINSLIFWRKRLHGALKNDNVILTLFHRERKAYPSLQTIADVIHSMNKNIIITGYAKFRNRRFLSLTLANLEMKEYVIENLRKIDDYEIAYLHWVDEAMLDYISVDWLSDTTDLLLTIECIEQYMDIVSAQREITELNNGSKCNSGKVIFRGHIKKHVSVDDIPHITKIDGLDSLVYVQGRPVQCFICSLVGHRALQCKKAYCRICRQVLFKSHSCVWRNNYDNCFNNNDNGQCLSTELNSLTDNFVNISAAEQIYKKDDSSRNLFWNPKVKSNFDLAVTMEKSNVEGMYEDRLGGPSIAEDLTNIGLQKEKQFKLKSTVAKKCQKERALETNVYIRQEEVLGDPNFVLVDTSMEDSDSDESECIGYEQMESNVEELVKSSEISRSLLQESLTFMKTKNLQHCLFSENVEEKDKELLLIKDNEDFQVEQGKGAIPKTFSKDMVKQIKKKGNIKKKKKGK